MATQSPIDPWVPLDRAHGDLPSLLTGTNDGPIAALVRWATAAMWAFATVRRDVRELFSRNAGLNDRVTELENRKVDTGDVDDIYAALKSEVASDRERNDTSLEVLRRRVGAVNQRFTQVEVRVTRLKKLCSERFGRLEQRVTDIALIGSELAGVVRDVDAKATQAIADLVQVLQLLNADVETLKARDDEPLTAQEEVVDAAPRDEQWQPDTDIPTPDVELPTHLKRALLIAQPRPDGENVESLDTLAQCAAHTALEITGSKVGTIHSSTLQRAVHVLESDVPRLIQEVWRLRERGERFDRFQQAVAEGRVVPVVEIWQGESPFKPFVVRSDEPGPEPA